MSLAPIARGKGGVRLPVTTASPMMAFGMTSSPVADRVAARPCASFRFFAFVRRKMKSSAIRSET
jgi:hypothetical protein